MSNTENTTKSNKVNKKAGFFSKSVRYFKELKSETKKLVWPTKNQVINNTIVVITMLIIVGLFVWGLDLLFDFGVQSLLNLKA